MRTLARFAALKCSILVKACRVSCTLAESNKKSKQEGGSNRRVSEHKCCMRYTDKGMYWSNISPATNYATPRISWQFDYYTLPEGGRDVSQNRSCNWEAENSPNVWTKRQASKRNANTQPMVAREAWQNWKLCRKGFWRGRASIGLSENRTAKGPVLAGNWEAFTLCMVHFWIVKGLPSRQARSRT